MRFFDLSLLLGFLITLIEFRERGERWWEGAERRPGGGGWGGEREGEGEGGESGGGGGEGSG